MERTPRKIPTVPGTNDPQELWEFNKESRVEGGQRHHHHVLQHTPIRTVTKCPGCLQRPSPHAYHPNCINHSPSVMLIGIYCCQRHLPAHCVLRQVAMERNQNGRTSAAAQPQNRRPPTPERMSNKGSACPYFDRVCTPSQPPYFQTNKERYLRAKPCGSCCTPYPQDTKNTGASTCRQATRPQRECIRVQIERDHLWAAPTHTQKHRRHTRQTFHTCHKRGICGSK